MLRQLRESYAVPRERFERPGPFNNHAGVLIAVTDQHDDPEIILTLRAAHLSSHSGEVSFPGGKWEEADRTLVDTALRESYEEIGLPPGDVDVINSQPPMTSRWGIEVTPFVGIVPGDVQLSPNPNEIAAIFRVPLSHFVEDKRTQTDVYFRDGEEWWSPVYHYHGYKIWGLTAKMLLEFVNSGWGLELGRESAAPEIERKPLRAKTK
ncbi:NUDIX hydrolase [Aurantivibrio plasticivorans]